MRIAVRCRVAREGLSAKRHKRSKPNGYLREESSRKRKAGTPESGRDWEEMRPKKEGAGGHQKNSLLCRNLFITPAFQHLFCPLVDPEEVYFPLKNLKELRTDPSSTSTLFSSYIAPHFSVIHWFIQYEATTVYQPTRYKQIRENKTHFLTSGSQAGISVPGVARLPLSVFQKADGAQH